jgi:energy-coupling factor transporter ATP-binding protein EcfA2
MLTRLRVKNFKTLEDADIPLGSSVVFVGPNNSGKTSALQALALWQNGVRAWNARRSDSSTARLRTGVTLNRRDLTHTPVSGARFLWHCLRVNSVSKENGSQNTQNIYIDIVVDGETAGISWSCGLRFNYGNPESIYCRPLKAGDEQSQERLQLPKEASTVSLAMLPPMSGLASEEAELQAGRIAVLLGEGQTAQVLRNLCLQVYQKDANAWDAIRSEIERCFGIQLGLPERDLARGTVSLSYRQHDIELDLPSAGRGMQQVLLLLAHLHANRASVLLLDEPDAHLEILRQRQVYSMLSETARKTGSQIIVATHSEVVLNEAADKDVVVAFVGQPHRIDDRGSQVLKSLKEIGFEQYYQAEIKGFVLYLEGSTDLAILKGFAKALNHPAYVLLDDIFVHYVCNQPPAVQAHFFGLKEAKPDLVGFAVFDKLERGMPAAFAIPNKQWRKREIENYLCTRQVLIRYAEGREPDDLVGRALRETRREAMEKAIDAVETALKTLRQDPWSDDFKVSDQFLPNVFVNYFEYLKSENWLNKSGYHVLTDFINAEEIDPDVVDCLDRIVEVARGARPRVSPPIRC